MPFVPGILVDCLNLKLEWNWLASRVFITNTRHDDFGYIIGFPPMQSNGFCFIDVFLFLYKSLSTCFVFQDSRYSSSWVDSRESCTGMWERGESKRK